MNLKQLKRIMDGETLTFEQVEELNKRKAVHIKRIRDGFVFYEYCGNQAMEPVESFKKKVVQCNVHVTNLSALKPYW